MLVTRTWPLSSKLMATTDVKAYKIGVMRLREGDEPQVEFLGDLFAQNKLPA